MIRPCAILAIVAAWTVASGAAATSVEGRWRACALPEVEGRAECTRIAVPESRSGRSPRWISLRIARLLPLEGAAQADPIVILQGGPGQSAVSLADFYGGESWRLARRNRAILLVDQRGTGESNPLRCDLGGRDGEPQSWFYEMFPDAPLRRCRAELTANADPAEYTTEAAMLDLEEVRRRLGYDRINLYGTSYGTRVALRYLDAFPGRVRSLVLKGVVEPGAVVPADFATDTERAIELLIADCANDPACRSAYPELREDYRRMRARLAQGPVVASIEVEGRRHPIALTQGIVSSSVRSLLQATPAAAQLPRLIAAGADGDFAPLGAIILQLRRGAGALSTGLMLSVICAEDAPLLARLPPPGESGFLGNYWRDRTLSACGIWNVPATAMEFRRPARHETPALLVSGFLDPATPPSGAEAVRRFLPNSAHLVVRGGSHSFAGMRGCVDVAIASFLDSLEPARLDLSCGEEIRRPGFALGR